MVYAEQDPKWTLFGISRHLYDSSMEGISDKGLMSQRVFPSTPAAGRGKSGIVYSLNTYRDQILRINPHTLTRIGVFAEDVSIASPGGMGVGDDGSVFLWDNESKSMFHFAPDGSLEQVANEDISDSRGMTVGSDGLVYMSDHSGDGILRYDPVQRWFMGIFADGGGLDAPGELEFGPDGNLYVTSTGTNEVLHYDGETGEFADVFISADPEQVFEGPLAFGPEGDIYLAWSDEYVHRYDGQTGNYIGEFAHIGNCTGLFMVPEPATAAMLAFGGLLMMRRRRR